MIVVTVIIPVSVFDIFNDIHRGFIYINRYKVLHFYNYFIRFKLNRLAYSQHYRLVLLTVCRASYTQKGNCSTDTTVDK